MFGNRWINQVDALVFALRFIDDVSVGDTPGPSSHVGSRCHDVLMGFFSTSYLHIPKTKHRKKNLKWIPPKQLQVDALMYLCLIKRRIRKKMKLLKSPGFHLEISAMVKRRALMDSAKGFRWVCTKTRAMDRTVCNLFLFPKKPYCYCNIMKNINVVLWRLILHYIVDFLFSFWFSFLTEMLYHIF